MADQVDDQILSGYINGYTKPVQWVAWWAAEVDAASKAALGTLLFDPKTDALVDLTSPEVRASVIRVVLTNPPLRRKVEAEWEELLVSLVERMGET
ncbi:hypothetical protein [Paludisphaera soli]|uniref:hypothetical protein n=1 Tax=Paludisphaera soli TaxID=2712865 RepID=UPI0013EDD3F7|nr:hypothetical protein [Paludisphaera soli]